MRTRNILWPTDFSETALHALSYAVEMANFYHVGLRILHVVEQLSGDENFQILAITPEELMQNMEAVAAQQMQGLLAKLDTDVKVETLVRRCEENNIAEQIVKEAQQGDIGMIVMASHGRTGLAHLWHDNVAEAVTARASCPVLIVK
ncbi:universal stress protein A [Shewanella sp. NFH-SH190041]|uniref:universal stress protein n=1 Tax=Shewanella sp. NFH-SH190041 TaxID=2950245 RepID=UPI0021C406AC|nr:universal stress protein [Shewanella sp. NFH-SH190041]BDM65530.1 universal stress protein A [Shewanella sp. NFH-SH190041]